MAVQATADVHDRAIVSESAQIWHLAQIREGAVIGNHVVVGRGAYVGTGVHVGDASKIQNYALVYEPAELGSGVFVGPGAILTNDRHPRAANPDGLPKSAADWHPVGVTVEDGASIGARAVCVAPITLGRYCMVAAGSVVVADVPPFALVAGSPARVIGWVGRHGVRLERTDDPTRLRCPVSGDLYEVDANGCVTNVD